MTSAQSSRRFIWASLLAVGTARLVGACSDDEKAQGEPNVSAGEGGEGNGKGGSAGSRTTGGSSGAAVGGTTAEGGHGGEPTGTGGEGASETGGTAGTAGKGGGAGSVGSSGAGGKATAGASGGGTGGVSGDGGGGGEGGGGSECDDEPVVVTWAPKAWAIDVNEGYVYYTTHDINGVVARSPVTGGASQNLATTERFPHEVAVSNGRAFWVALGPQPGHVIQASVTGANRLEIGTGVLNGIFSLSATPSNVYYVTNLNVVSSLSVGGGTPLTVSGGPFNSTVVDVVRQGNSLFWTNSGVGTFVATQPQTATIRGADLGGVPTIFSLVTLLDYPQFRITANDQNVFWSDENAIYRTSRIGGTFAPVTSLPPAQVDESPIVDIVSDEAFLFYADGTTLYRVPVAGGNSEIMTEGWDRITRLGIDETSVFFTDSVRGAVVRVAKCATATRASGNVAEARGHAESSSSVARLAGAAIAASDAETASAPTCTSTPGPHGCPEPSVAATLPGAFGLALDESYFYATSYGTSGSVVRAPLSGGAPTPLSTEVNAHDIAVDDVNVYVCLQDSAAGHLVRVPKAGGSHTAMATGVANYGVGRVTSDGTFAYYVTGFNALYRVFTAGGTPTIVEAGPFGSTVTDLAVDDGEMFFMNDGTFNSNFSAKLPGTAYVGRTYVSGSSTLGHTALKRGLDSPQFRIAVDDAYVFFIDDNFVYRKPRAGGDTIELVPITPAAGTIVDLLSDGQNVYFADVYGVYRVPVGGGSVQTLTSGWAGLRSIAVNATDLYFTDNTTGAVLKLPK